MIDHRSFCIAYFQDAIMSGKIQVNVNDFKKLQKMLVEFGYPPMTKRECDEILQLIKEIDLKSRDVLIMLEKEDELGRP